MKWKVRSTVYNKKHNIMTQPVRPKCSALALYLLDLLTSLDTMSDDGFTNLHHRQCTMFFKHEKYHITYKLGT